MEIRAPGITLLIVLCGTLAAQPHPAYQPHKVTGVATYKGSGDVGNVLFAFSPLPRDQKTYTGLIDHLDLPKGVARTVNERGFFACTLQEAMNEIKRKEPTAASFQEQTNLKLVKSGELLESETARSPVNATWAPRSTAGTDTTGKIDAKLRTAATGEYALHIEHYITYDYVTNKATGARGPSAVLLAAGKLPIVVK